MTDLRHIGEFGAIERLCRFLPARQDVIIGPGDDCAVVRAPAHAGYDWLLTSDPVTEGIHFLPGDDRHAVGHKAVARALSDLAAMGGKPLWALIDVGAPGDTAVEALEAIYAGASATAQAHGLAIVGGDLGRAAALTLHVFALGEVPAGSAVTRAGAHADDGLYVTGALGGSRLGRHLSFTPRVREGQWLREGCWTEAMLDISDGLLADLRHLLDAATCGAAIALDHVPVSEALRHLPREEACRRALTEGEDFELLFAVPAGNEHAFEPAWRQAFETPCTRIGTVTAERSLVITGLDGEPREIHQEGYDHFAED